MHLRGSQEPGLPWGRARKIAVGSEPTLARFTVAWGMIF